MSESQTDRERDRVRESGVRKMGSEVGESAETYLGLISCLQLHFEVPANYATVKPSGHFN